jgi:hypothetical protein
LVLKTHCGLPIAVAAMLLCGVKGAAAEPPLAVPVDGRPFAARLVAADAQWRLAFDADGKRKTVPAADLAWWGTCAEPAGELLVLADGGILVAQVTAADKQSLTAESELLGTLKLPRAALTGVVFHPPADRKARDALLDRVLAADGKSDRLWLENGDEVIGSIDAVENDKARVVAEVGPLDVELRSVTAAAFAAARLSPTAPPDFRAWVGLGDGSRLLARGLTLDGSSADLAAVAGQTWKIAAAQVTFLQPLGGRAVYLSDRRPAEYRFTPYLELAWPYRTDRNVNGGMLRSGGRFWLKGLGVHSGARLTYQLDRSWSRFQAELGIDDSTRGGGSVNFRVLVDGQVRLAGGPVRGGEPPVPISVDLHTARRLELVVDYGERGDLLDHADWLNARLVK